MLQLHTLLFIALAPKSFLSFVKKRERNMKLFFPSFFIIFMTVRGNNNDFIFYSAYKRASQSDLQYRNIHVYYKYKIN